MELLEQILNAGVVGCGGAGFPTHVKLKCTVDTFIVNGAECEPLLRTDRWLMRHKAPELIAGAELAAKAVGATRACIALKETYLEEQQALSAAIAAANSPVTLFQLTNFYPAGDEQMIVLDVTGKTVPPAGIPLDVGAVVSNVATLFAIYEAARGIPFTQKYLTVTGEVAAPTVLCAPIGTSFSRCIEAAGGTDLGDYRVLSGGPLMGKLLTKEEARSQVVTKTTSGIVVLPADIPLVSQRETPLRTVLRRAKTSCIQCSTCTELCPRHLSGHPLQPHKIMRKLAFAENVTDILDDFDVRQALTCSECGVCETYACPMGLQPRKVNAYLKGELSKNGIRYEKTEGPFEAQEVRGWRLSPSKRIATRLGVERYYDYQIDTLQVVTPQWVSIPLKQHIGAPCIPCVAVGDSVTLGQKIGSLPENALGTTLSASMDGRVAEISDCIVIERSEGSWKP